jgi:hypothetical protein
MPTVIVTCAHCQKSFTHKRKRGPVARYCSRECFDAARHPRLPRQDRTCACCGTHYQGLGSTRFCSACRKSGRRRKITCATCGKQAMATGRRFCSAACASRSRKRRVYTCVVCGDGFHAKRGKSKHLCCSRKCGFNLQRKQWKEKAARGKQAREAATKAARLQGLLERTHPCQKCGTAVVGKGTKLCRPCRVEVTAAKSVKPSHRPCVACGAAVPCGRGRMRCGACAAQRRKQTHKAAHHRRRARQRGVVSHNINPRDIFARDNWTCGICGKPVDPAAAYPDPMSVSLDHVVPIAKGGPHIASNLQCSHMGCNSSKSDT